MARNSSRAQQVADEIETELLTSRAPAGSRVGLRTELIQRFEVSPSVMNEALRILRDRDLITVKPGVNGGVFVASHTPHVRLAGMDLWFRGGNQDPRQLFEARAYLEDVFARVALSRATPEDIRAMEWALDEIRGASSDAHSYLNANMRLHVAIARASRIDALVGLHQAITAILTDSLVRAEYIAGHDKLLRHNIEVHANMVAAIRDQNSDALEKTLSLHRRDMIRDDMPEASPPVDDIA
ncbi:FCD domain-containing protein [Saccharomonospora sp. NPDC046836]|uniref:FadR/GntR family transcriptional regulator n=1 Tax=Saccharomonospora sp. NPDC046836 TaxID=3156921 RepID=UPI00340F88D5